MCTPSIITLNNKKKVVNTNYKITHYTQHVILYEQKTNTAAHNEFQDKKHMQEFKRQINTIIMENDIPFLC